MIRRRIAILFLPAFLVLCLAAAMAWLLRTEPGARWAWSQAIKFVPGSLTAQGISGDLQSGLSFRAVAFANESTSVDAGNVRLRVAFDLFPPAVSVESLKVDRLTIRSTSEPNTEGSSSPEEILTAMALPLPISFENVELSELLVEDAQGHVSFEGNSFYLTGRWQDRLTIGEARLESLGMQWQATGEVDFRAPFRLDANVRTRFEPGAGGTVPPHAMNFEASFAGTMADLKAEIVLDQPAATLQGTIRDLLSEPNLELHLSAPLVPWPLATDAPGVTVRALTADISGSWLKYKLEMGGSLELPDLPASSFQMIATGDLNKLEIGKLQVSGDLAQLESDGAITWSDTLAIELNNTLTRFDPGPWITGWPADHLLAGTLDLGIQAGGLRFQNVELEAVGTGFTLRGSGRLDTEADVVEAEVNWTSLQWPLDATQPDFRSESGQVQLQGKPDNWSASGRLQVQAADWPAGQVRLIGTGNLESVKLQAEEGQVMGGRFKGQFAYGWTRSRPWSANFQAEDVDVSALTSDYPGVISADIIANGQLDPQKFDIDIRELNGTLRGLPIEASGAIAYAGDTVWARDLQVRSGPSHVLLNGNARDAGGIRFSGHIDSLGAFFEGASGDITGEGEISTNPADPRIDLDVQARDLSWEDWRLASLTVIPQGQAVDSAATRFVLAGLEHGEKSLGDITLTVSGPRPLENIQIEASLNESSVQASLNGSVSHWDTLSLLGWHGVIDHIRVSNDPLEFLQLEQPAGLVVSSTHLEVDPACFRGPRNGRMCVDARWDKMGELAINANLDTISLGLAQLYLGSSVIFTQTLSGELHWQKAPGQNAIADVQILVSPGQLLTEDDELIFSTGPGKFGFRILDGQLSAGNLDLTIPNAGFIDTDFSIPDISHGLDSPIEGHLQIALSQIEPLTRWISVVDGMKGTVNADARFSGTLTDPRMTGYASLVGGRFQHPASGVTIKDIRIAGAVYEYDFTEFNGSFTSGAGQGRIKTAVNFHNFLKPEITVEFSGQNLTLMNVPDMTVKANPDFRLRWHDGALDIDGSILIPTARISPRYLPATTAAESDDLVIVAGEQPVTEDSFIDRSRLRLNGSVAVSLGEDVTVTAERAKAKLSGKVVFNWNDNLLPMADGTYLVSGKITAYGQLLEVSDGRVSFPRVPADNPHLNIAAEREIYGNVQVKRAGVLISGTLKRPTMAAYTSPETTEERALTLLVTGHDFDYDQGIGAVEVGMYIAPKLYVSYGIGLFDSQSVISVRYDLKHGFGIKATSGQRETGADLNYTIEH